MPESIALSGTYTYRSIPVREENLLLAYLPDEERQRLEPYLRKVVLDFQQVLIEPNKQITDIYFPYDAITSTVQEMSDGDTVETRLMGVEGFVGECLEIVEKQFEKIFERPMGRETINHKSIS